jgi:hypothetical protein
MTPVKDVECFLSSKKTPDVFFVGMVLALVLAASEVALACPICFRVEESATTDGVQAAVLVLVGVTTVVLGAFARFVVGFAKRESRNSKEPEC